MDLQKAFSQSGKNPQSILKIVLGISLALLVMWLFLVSKMETGTVVQSNDPEVQERTIGLQESLKKAPGYGSEETSGEETSMFQNAFITFLFMVSVLVGVWYWSKKKNKGSASIEHKSREIDTHYFSENAQLKFMEVNDEIWVVGLSDQNINLLHRYPKQEWKETDLSVTEGKSDMQKGPKNMNGRGDFKALLKLVSK